ncbi:alpha/beta fold hydrolase [Streptomyces sp. DH12]|uniref:alpha/beta fold hydrolase n=1 Tax=Streptomyces sp. DH12 TaxID=2857010 RepID=UPI001E5851F6|nr:alpha/beta fold hydrolase [Streptomyces sp. DH12]
MPLSHDLSGRSPAGGTDVVLLHSSVCDRRMWDPLVPVLADAGHRVVRCDFRGFGGTPVAEGPYDDAADVEALLDRLGVERFALVGASYGGQVALRIAARRRDAVTALVLLCSAAPDHEPGPELLAFDAREEALFAAGDLAGAVELNVATWLGPEADDGVRARVRDMQRHAFEVQSAAAEEHAPDGPAAEEHAPDEPEVDLSRIGAPCLAVSGAHDLADFREIARSMPERVPGARHVELPWAGHLPSLERPAEVGALLTDFLRVAVPEGRGGSGGAMTGR